MFECIYCRENLPDKKRSLEHIWPDGLGGNYGPSFFMIKNVCGFCNNTLGLYVDAEFQRNFFRSTEEMTSALAFLDTKQASALPLVFMGKIRAEGLKNEICESWTGPRGEGIYFFHKEDNENFVTYAGGDPITRRRSDPGRVYMSFSKSNHFWIKTAILSVKKKFKNSQFRLLTQVEDNNLFDFCSPETKESTKDRTLLETIWKEKTIGVHNTIHLDHGRRFQCKIAIGFGNALFGNSFQNTDYETILREALWERDFQKRSKIPVLQTNVISRGQDDMERFLGYEGAYSFIFQKIDKYITLKVYSPSRHSFETVIATESKNLKNELFNNFYNGFVILLFVGLKRHLGPIPIEEYVNHKLSFKTIDDLQDIETKRRTIDQLELAVKKWDIPQTEN